MSIFEDEICYDKSVRGMKALLTIFKEVVMKKRLILSIFSISMLFSGISSFGMYQGYERRREIQERLERIDEIQQLIKEAEAESAVLRRVVSRISIAGVDCLKAVQNMIEAAKNKIAKFEEEIRKLKVMK